MENGFENKLLKSYINSSPWLYLLSIPALRSGPARCLFLQYEPRIYISMLFLFVTEHERALLKSLSKALVEHTHRSVAVDSPSPGINRINHNVNKDTKQLANNDVNVENDGLQQMANGRMDM